MSTNILHLPAYRVLHVDTNDHDYHIAAEVVEPQKRCLHCFSDNLVGFGRREQMVRDLPMHGKRVGLYVNTRRFRCRGCGKTFYESLPEVDEKRLMTKRLVDWMGRQSIKRTFASLAEEVGCTEFTVRAVFRDYINELERTVRFETPKWMGIDEIHLIKPRGVIANIHNNTVVEVLRDRNKKTLADYLFRLDGKQDVQYVAMDMWRPYLDAVETVLPHARVVVDKFHVLRMGNDAMEKARKSLRADLEPKQRRGLMHDRFVLLKRASELNDRERLLLDGWIRNYPLLGESYRLKEEFFGIYDAPSRQQALLHYDAWSKSIPPELHEHYQPILIVWSNWQPHILEYFNHPVTNAYTESLNNLIRVMNRLGRGYSFEALRAKILFTEGAHKVVQPKPKFQRRQIGFALKEPMFEDMLFNEPSTHREDSAKNYGADISTLIEMIENGEL